MSTYIEIIVEPIAILVIQAMLNSIWQGIIITAFVFGLVKLLRETNAASRYLMWMVMLIVLSLLPIINTISYINDIYSENNLLIDPEVQKIHSSSFSYNENGAYGSTESSKGDNSGQRDKLLNNSFSEESTLSRALDSTFLFNIPVKRLPLALIVLWLLGALILLGRIPLSYRYMKHLKINCIPLPMSYQKLLKNWLQIHNIRRSVWICYSKNITMPMVIGLIKPLILVPKSLIKNCTSDELSHIIFHELAHIRRRDNWTNLLQKFIEAALFFQPAVWIVKNQLNLEREIACDESAVSLSGKNYEYASFLVKLAELTCVVKKPVEVACAALTKKHIFKRIEALLQINRSFTLGVSIFGITAVMILLVFGMLRAFTMSPVVNLEQKKQEKYLTLDMPFDIHNDVPEWGDTPRISLEFIQKIGGIDVTEENYVLNVPRDVGRDKDGNIYVLDADNYRVQKFDANGKYVATIGKKGNKPGEFEKPSTLDINTNGNIVINDQGVIKILSQDGKEIKRISLDKPASYFQLTPSGMFVTGPLNSDDGKLAPLINVFNPYGKHVRDFCLPVDFGNITANINENLFYYAVDNSDNIYVAFMYQNRIEKYSVDGKLLYRMKRKLHFDFVRTTYKERKTIFGVAASVTKFGKSISRGIDVDYKNRLWVLSRKNEDEFTFEIFNEDGVLLGTVPWVEQPVDSKLRIINDRLYVILKKTQFINKRTQKAIVRGIENAVYEYRIVER